MISLSALYCVLMSFICFAWSFIGYEILSRYKPFKRFSDLFKSKARKQEYTTYIYKYNTNIFKDDYILEVKYNIHNTRILK